MTDNVDNRTQRVKYDSSKHFAVLTQMNGSVWPRVFKYCLLNVLNISTIIFIRQRFSIDLTYSDKGHSFLSMIVAFLIVTRSNITYRRFMESRGHVSNALRSCRELIQFAVTFTRYSTSQRARKWRFDLARKTIVLLRSVVTSLEFESTGTHVWKTPALTQTEKAALRTAVGDNNERSPYVLAMFIRSTIASNVEFLDTPLHVNKELKLYSFVSDFITAYANLMKLVNTQFPFPLAQMNRTFVFLWAYTLPWVLYHDDISIPSLIVLVFFITYAFVGLEFVSIELDDPYGDDPNDLDILGLAKTVFEDIYICIYDCDGEESAKGLKKYFSVTDVHEEKFHPTKRAHKRLATETAWEMSADAPVELEAGDDRSKLLKNAELQVLNSSNRSFESDMPGSNHSFEYPNYVTGASSSEGMPLRIDTRHGRPPQDTAYGSTSDNGVYADKNEAFLRMLQDQL